jgi:hypothetical protein
MDHSSAGIYLFDSTVFPYYNPDTYSTYIVRLPMSIPAFLPAVDGTSFANPITDATAVRDGTAAGFGLFTRDSTFVWGGSVSAPGMDWTGDMILDQVIIQQDQTVSLTGAYYLVP